MGVRWVAVKGQLFGWYEEDGIWYGWENEANTFVDEPTLVVKEVPEGGKFAGWTIEVHTGRMECVTHDHETVEAAKQEIMEVMAFVSAKYLNSDLKKLGF